MKQEYIRKERDSWIDQEELPPRANLKVLKAFDPYDGMDEDEIQAYLDFIQWAMAQEHLLLLSIPRPQYESDFWQVEMDEFGNDISAFNTMDYQRLHPHTFNKYHYKLRKTYEKVQDLAILHSCITHREGKENTHRRFKNLVENEFRDRATMLIETLKNYGIWCNKKKLLLEVAELNSCIRKCNEIWQKHAYQD